MQPLGRRSMYVENGGYARRFTGTGAYFLFCTRPRSRSNPGTRFGAPLCIALLDRVECRACLCRKCPPIADVGSTNGVHRRDNMTRIGDHRCQGCWPLPAHLCGPAQPALWLGHSLRSLPVCYARSTFRPGSGRQSTYRRNPRSVIGEYVCQS